jgi:hypothetical protein
LRDYPGGAAQSKNLEDKSTGRRKNQDKEKDNEEDDDQDDDEEEEEEDEDEEELDEELESQEEEEESSEEQQQREPQTIQQTRSPSSPSSGSVLVGREIRRDSSGCTPAQYEILKVREENNKSL